MEHIRQACKTVLGVIIPDCYLYKFRNSQNLKEELKKSFTAILLKYSLPLNLTQKTFFKHLLKVNCMVNDKIQTLQECDAKEEIVYNALISVPQYVFEGVWIPDSSLGTKQFYITQTPCSKVGYTNILYENLIHTSFHQVGKIIFGKITESELLTKFLIPYNERIDYVFESCEFFLEVARFAPMLKNPFDSSHKFEHTLDYYFFPIIPGLELISGKLYLDKEEQPNQERELRLLNYDKRVMLNLNDARRAWYVGYNKYDEYVGYTPKINICIESESTNNHVIKILRDKFSINYISR